jgi:putative colanic acid biosynthesis UDP-glucose lipid carrier transferase
MNEPIVFKRSASVALWSMLRAIAPALVSAGSLFVIASFFGVRFENQFLMLAIVVAVLASIIVQLPTLPSFQLMPSEWPTIASLLLRWMALLGILLAIGYAAKVSDDFSRRVVVTWALVTPLLLIGATLLMNEFMRRYLFSPQNTRKAVFAGYNEASLALAERLQEHRELGAEVQGFFDDRSAERLGLMEGTSLLGGLAELPGYIAEHGVDVIFIALPMRHVQRVVQLLDDLHDTTASIYYVPDVFVFDLIQSRSGEILGIPVVAMCETPFHGYRGIVKRLMDVVIASVALVLLAPLMLIIALLVKFGSPGPVIFRQRRHGLDGGEITVFKFRTMTVTEDGWDIRQATRDDDRVTPVGRVLRRYSLDELPQLFNVVQGRMSLVGPRPHAVAHNEQYRKLIKGYMIRHKVLPGMTGLAQVSGCRGETAEVEDMRARIEYDLDYLRRWTPLLDLKIMWQTVTMLLGDHKAY